MKITKFQLRELIRKELTEAKADRIINVKDLYKFIEAGKAMKFELEKEGMKESEVVKALVYYIKKRIMRS